MAKVGRPRSENPKDSRVTIRLREEDMKRLEAYAEARGISKSEVLIQGMEHFLSGQKKTE